LISLQSEIPAIQAIVYFISAVVPIYFTFILKQYNNRNNHFQNLTIVLAAFVIMQGIYHSAGALGFSLLAVVFTYIGDNIAYQHGLHFCQEVYPYRNQNKV
jgi:hypothetical protein